MCKVGVCQCPNVVDHHFPEPDIIKKQRNPGGSPPARTRQLSSPVKVQLVKPD